MATQDTLSRYTNTYTTFSGADIVCTFGGQTIGTLSGITWSITREKAPIYTMGSPNPRSFSRGKRGIAGSLIFTVFDRPSLYNMLFKHAEDNSVNYFTRTSNILPSTDGQSNLTHKGITPPDEQTTTFKAAFPYYADQIPPFDVSITFLNEYGNSAMRSLYGLELLNEGSGASMDDIVIEETMTFVARELGPMYATGSPGNPSFSPGSSALDSRIIRP